MTTKTRHALQLKFEELRRLRKEVVVLKATIQHQSRTINAKGAEIVDLTKRLHSLLTASLENFGPNDYIEYRYRISRLTLRLLKDPAIAHQEAWRQVCETIEKARS